MLDLPNLPKLILLDDDDFLFTTDPRLSADMPFTRRSCMWRLSAANASLVRRNTVVVLASCNVSQTALSSVNFFYPRALVEWRL